MMGFDWWRRDTETTTPGVSVQEIVSRVQAERREQVQAEDARAADAGLWPNGWPHEAPDHPLSVTEAHKTMQRHRGCRADGCPRKAAAWRTLIAAKKVKPDSSRAY
ncbi:hypothetical protein AWN90_11045 [Nocardia terpenica]|uniref:Uncharacterized protein n=2 Tax=Nocardia terpenica TaxID=455432 RepID=A0A164HD60_9NOCA|nr:hypothetical protein AWN90_11045 [Nocardia terpenica]